MKGDIINELLSVIEKRKQSSAESSYVASLFHKGTDAILKKIGEESTEVILAAKSNDQTHIVKELTDLLFHSLVLISHLNIDPNDILNELEARFGVSGLEEKANRKKELQ